MTHLEPSSPAPDTRRGSALTVVLMVLVILTAMGISLLLITDIETQAGGFEKATTRAFYAGEAGIGVGTARILTARNCKPVSFEISDIALGSSYRLGYRVSLPKIDVLIQQRCNFCPANEDFDPELYRVAYLMNSEAQRLGWANASVSAPADATIQTEQRIISTIDIQPIDDPAIDCAPDSGGTGSESNQT